MLDPLFVCTGTDNKSRIEISLLNRVVVVAGQEQSKIRVIDVILQHEYWIACVHTSNSKTNGHFQ